MVGELIPILVLLGLASSLLNTTVGGGGGVLLIPLLILLFHLSANQAIGTTFVGITAGAVIATLAFSRQGRVDYKAGTLFAALTLPGVVVGAFITDLFQGPFFELLLGVVIVSVAIPMLKQPVVSKQSDTSGGWSREFTDAFQRDFSYRINTKIAIPSVVITGLFAGTFGAGGGLILTPTMVMSGFPVHIALGTVRLVAMGLALGASITRFAVGHVNIEFALLLSIGSVVGGLIGARIARVPRSEVLNKAVAIAIIILGLLLVVQAISSVVQG